MLLESALCRDRCLPELFAGTSSDLSLLEQLSEVGRMVAHISHDLRHPLTAILANAEFLSQSDLSLEERGDLYGEIRCAIEWMNALISSLLESSAGREKLQLSAGNIAEMIQRAIRMASMKPEFRLIAIHHRHEGPAMGWFDTARMERVFANLLLNACEAVSSYRGRVVITTAADSTGLRAAVWDNGPGIPQGIRESLFDPFVSCGKASGSGLGLAIARKIVEDHGGEIHLEDGDESGTTFMLTIPFAYHPQRPD